MQHPPPWRPSPSASATSSSGSMIIQALYSLLGVGRDVVVGGLERQGGGLVVDLKLGDDAQRVCTFVSSLPKELQSYALTEARRFISIRFLNDLLKGREQPPAPPFGTFRNTVPARTVRNVPGERTA